MREILFRGKNPKGEMWFFGDLINAECKIPPYFPTILAVATSGEKFAINVDPKTVGQFTGLTDKNGKKIFEGDIVKVTDDYGETNFPDGGIGDVGFYDGLWYVSGEVNNGLNDLTKVYYVEVIGNIHDNPELLVTA